MFFINSKTLRQRVGKALLFTTGTLIAALALGVFSLVFLAIRSGYSNGFLNLNGRLYAQTERAIASRIGIEVLYNEIAREGFGHFVFSVPGYTSATGTTYAFCGDFNCMDGFGNGYYGVKFEMADNPPDVTNIVVITKDRAGDFGVMSCPEMKIAGKGLSLGKTVIFIWSPGPDGINSFSGWDDITFF